MLVDSAADEELKKGAIERIDRRQIVKRLMALRVSKGKSQQEIADQLGCSQSRISKLENGMDDEIRLGDLRDYLHALDQDVSLFVCQKDWQSFQQIKFCAAMIKRSLSQLVELAGDDPTIERGVTKAHIETLVNFVRVIVDSAEKLPSLPQMVPGIIEADESSDDSELNRELEASLR